MFWKDAALGDVSAGAAVSPAAYASGQTFSLELR